jgi:tight adherence protein C
VLLVYLIYLLIPGAMCALFLVSGGFFKALSLFLKRKLRFLPSAVEAGDIRRALLILLAADLLAFSVSYTKETGTVEKGYLVRDEAGGLSSEREVTVMLGKKKHRILLTVDPRELSGKEQEKLLKKAAERLPALILNGMKKTHVDKPLNLPDETGSPPVLISWTTSDSGILDWDGRPGPDVPPEGADVTLTAELSVGEMTRELVLPLRIYPEKVSEEEAIGKEVQAEIAGGKNRTKRIVRLPEAVNGQAAVWSEIVKDDGPAVLLAGILFAAISICLVIRKAEREKEERDALLLRDYPGMISKLVLLSDAGLSLKRSLEQLSDDYRRRYRQKGVIRPGYEEIYRILEDTSRGKTELEAYRAMAGRSRLPEYKALSNVLVQTQTKGGREMMAFLEKESEEADAARRKRARAAGEEAGTKLLFPMVVMLGIVMTILLLPALLSFS